MNPQLNEAVKKRIDHLIRLGQPFTSADVWDQRIREIAKNLRKEEITATIFKNAPSLEAAQSSAVNLTFHDVIKSKRFVGRLWRRWDRVNEQWERKGKGRGALIVYYPSNDYERWHVKDSEVLVPHTVKPSTAKGKKEVEPPVRHIKPPEPTPAPDLGIIEALARDTHNLAGTCARLLNLLEMQIGELQRMIEKVAGDGDVHTK